MLSVEIGTIEIKSEEEVMLCLLLINKLFVIVILVGNGVVKLLVIFKLIESGRVVFSLFIGFVVRDTDGIIVDTESRDEGNKIVVFARITVVTMFIRGFTVGIAVFALDVVIMLGIVEWGWSGIAVGIAVDGGVDAFIGNPVVSFAVGEVWSAAVDLKFVVWRLAVAIGNWLVRFVTNWSFVALCPRAVDSSVKVVWTNSVVLDFIVKLSDVVCWSIVVGVIIVWISVEGTWLVWTIEVSSWIRSKFIVWPIPVTIGTSISKMLVTFENIGL